ncbi:MAG: pseudouridine synthase [Xanthomonadales bacterium]|nr:pseudouridine synthase [Xanthomonadales bacterium]
MLIAFNKPCGVLCQFSPSRCGEKRPTLADYIEVPGVYPAGRLDLDSEGLLMLTDDGRLQDRIANPAHGSGKVYLAQVEGAPRASQLQRLTQGVKLSDGPARVLRARLLPGKPGWLWARALPIKPRPNRPLAWLEMTLTEGRNRQVRRMTAAVGLPTLRLVRLRVGDWALDGLQPGEWRREDP